MVVGLAAAGVPHPAHVHEGALDFIETPRSDVTKDPKPSILIGGFVARSER
jgi:hypothetical protein